MNERKNTTHGVSFQPDLPNPETHLNQQINLCGFIDEHTFLTKTGDVGVLLEVQGLDYECLDSGSVDTYTKRLALPQ